LDPFKVFHILKDSGWKWRKLQPEAAICLQFTNALRAAFLEGRLCCVYTHIPMESVDKRATRSLMLKKDLGSIPGSPDYIFIGKDITLMIEMKTAKGVLSDNQKLFQEWANHVGARYHIARSSAEAEQLLIEHGLMLP
jgi:hypothetical protein